MTSVDSGRVSYHRPVTTAGEATEPGLPDDGLNAAMPNYTVDRLAAAPEPGARAHEKGGSGRRGAHHPAPAQLVQRRR